MKTEKDRLKWNRKRVRRKSNIKMKKVKNKKQRGRESGYKKEIDRERKRRRTG